MRRGALSIIVALSAIVSLSTATQPNICSRNSTIGSAVMSAVNLSWPGLQGVAEAAAKGDLGSACDLIAAYYKNGNTSSWLRKPAVAPGTRLVGGGLDAMVFNDTFNFGGLGTGRVPRNPDGGLDWLDKGPRDDREYQNVLNRHQYFVSLLEAYEATGNPVYPSFFDALVKDWVLHLPCNRAGDPNATACAPYGCGIVDPSQQKSCAKRTCSWGDSAGGACATGTFESPWRSLEMGIRMVQWPIAFFGFQRDVNFTVDARVLMLLAVSEHNAALSVDGGHAGRGTPNWEMTQWRGLLSSVVSFPELNGAATARDLALHFLSMQLAEGVYPDGVETEMAAGYDMNTAADFFAVLELLADARAPPPPRNFSERVEAMYEYGAYVSDPLGCLPRNGDSDLCGSGFDSQATEYFQRPDWIFVHTGGRNGSEPPQSTHPTPSVMFPWAGQAVMRGGYSSGDLWAWFDVGPYGSSSHAHRDKLNLNVRAFESMLLIDSGRFAYSGNDLSNTLHENYARYTRAHNTISIDGKTQQAAPALAAAPRPNSSWSFEPARDWVIGSMDKYDGIQGSARHSRSVWHQRGGGAGAGWLAVVDVISSDRPREVQATWHCHPNASVDTSEALVSIVEGVRAKTGQPTSAQIAVITATGKAASQWDTRQVVRGQMRNETADYQGWMSATYSDAWPASTLVFNRSMPTGQKTAVFGWLLLPSQKTGRKGSQVDASFAIDSYNGTHAGATVTIGTQRTKVTLPVETHE